MTKHEVIENELSGKIVMIPQTLVTGKDEEVFQLYQNSAAIKIHSIGSFENTNAIRIVYSKLINEPQQFFFESTDLGNSTHVGKVSFPTLYKLVDYITAPVSNIRKIQQQLNPLWNIDGFRFKLEQRTKKEE